MADPARRFPVSRWLALCLVLGLPVALVLLVAGATGLMSGRAAWIRCLGLLGMAGLFAVWQARAAWQVPRRTDDILGRESSAAADWDAFTVIGELGITVERLR